MIVADRFYNDFSQLNLWDNKGVYFVISHKGNIKFTTIKENDLPENRHENIPKDKLIKLTVVQSKNKYSKKLGRVATWDYENKLVIEVIANQVSWPANTISELYKNRWQVEIFFREIKQLFHIKSFIGPSQNAVMIQIWMVLIAILILKALKEMAKFKWHLSSLIY